MRSSVVESSCSRICWHTPPTPSTPWHGTRFGPGSGTRADFHYDDECDYGEAPVVKVEEEEPIVGGDDIPGEEPRDNTADYLSLLAWLPKQLAVVNKEGELPPPATRA
jgi:hypothetical protein